MNGPFLFGVGSPVYNHARNCSPLEGLQTREAAGKQTLLKLCDEKILNPDFHLPSDD